MVCDSKDVIVKTVMLLYYFVEGKLAVTDVGMAVKLCLIALPLIPIDIGIGVSDCVIVISGGCRRNDCRRAGNGRNAHH